MKRILFVGTMVLALALALAGCGEDQVAAPPVKPGATCVPDQWSEADIERHLTAEDVEVDSRGLPGVGPATAEARGSSSGGGSRGGGSFGGSRGSGSRPSGGSKGSGSRPSGGSSASSYKTKYTSKARGGKHKGGERFASSSPTGTYYSHYHNSYSAPYLWWYLAVYDDDDRVAKSDRLVCAENEDFDS